jgi:dihydropteroate synthase
MVEEGATIIDVGGESTRPGADPVPTNEELQRVLPVIEVLGAELPVPVSVDTSKPQVMRAAVAAGAGMINDIYALRREGALAAAVELGVPICLMHMQGEPLTMQDNPRYVDVVAEVRAFLAKRIDVCLAAGLVQEQLLIDPGFGFGKTFVHNNLLLKQLDVFHELGVPILVGMSRKGMIGAVLKLSVERRLYGSLALAILAAWQGAAIVRVHDVGPTVQALAMCNAIRSESG